MRKTRISDFGFRCDFPAAAVAAAAACRQGRQAQTQKPGIADLQQLSAADARGGRGWIHGRLLAGRRDQRVQAGSTAEAKRWQEAKRGGSLTCGAMGEPLPEEP